MASKSSFTPALLTVLRSGYSFSFFAKDVAAGITVGIVALPLALAFAIASGLGPERGLYTAIAAGFVMALLSGSRFQVSGPTGAFVVIVYGVVSRHGYEGLAITTFMAGILLLIFGFLRLGALIKYIPFPVTVGFTLGIALLIFSSQMKDFFGLPLADTPPEFFAKWHLYASNAVEFSPATIGVSLFTLAIILLVRRNIPRLPAPVAAVFGATLLVSLGGVPVDTIGSYFGELPRSLPEIQLPGIITFERLRILFPDALTIALLAGIESLFSCVVADSMGQDRHNSNMELVAQGAGNMAAALFGGFAATGAIARTAANIRSGAVSPISSIVHAAVLTACLLWLMPLVELVPLASLAAVLIVVAVDMSDLRTVRHILRGPKADWSVMLLTFTLTVVIDLTVAVGMGVVLASLLFMQSMSEMTDITDTTDNSAEKPQDVPLQGEFVPPDVHIFAVNGPLFFGVADRFQNVIDAIEKPPRVFILYLHNVPAVDMTGIHALESFLRRRDPSCHVFLADVPFATMRILSSVGLIGTVGEHNIFPTLHAALDRARQITNTTNH